MSPSDVQQRRAALDGRRSFIVQAPAGSGKTELLIQRFLSLLLSVDEPEQVVAITFTRKAAAEMRARIVSALARAEQGGGELAPHEAETQALAVAVLARDTERGWSLISQPQRLRIDTLDALNAWLARQLPLLAGGVAAATIDERADDHYLGAARRTVDRLARDDGTGAALQRLLELLDNALPRLEGLIVGLLPKRDQWLKHLLGRDEASLRGELERGLTLLVDESLDSIEALWPASRLDELGGLLRHAAARTDWPAVADAAAWCTDPMQLPDAVAGRLAFWRGAAALLLTSSGQFRRRITAAQGFGKECADAKAALLALLASLEGHDALREQLGRVASLPEPRYGSDQWQDLLALRTVLLHAVAELRVLFAERRSVDFVELALAALRALGDVDAPSELLLALDRRIEHLLVDEFQDTSSTQLRLLELLTAGWEPGDGRSLFLVGDPMQSIYRFRDADMALFERVKRDGVGQIRCDLLQLDANFRSAPALVGWVNQAFTAVFPPHRSQTDSSQATFFPSHAERAEGAAQGVFVHAAWSDEPDAELAEVVAVLARERERSSTQTMAILVQSRPHLLGLHDRLLARGWPVRALEIDAVAESQCGQDLIGLARALSHQGDRVAWLAVLRAPWCGLTWDDLERLCGDEPGRSVWALMHDEARLGKLSEDGCARLSIVRAVLHEAIVELPMLPFAHCVERCWHALGGLRCVSTEDRHLAEQFFTRLGELSRNGAGVEPATLAEAFSRPAPQSGSARPGGIEIMTIHRAKGLEFDTVVLFGLARPPRRDDAQALHWLERNGPEGTDLVLAPLQRQADALTRFLRRHEEAAIHAERARLLYVATTRARERLHLVCRLSPSQPEPPARSLLAWLWPTIGSVVQAAASEAPVAPAEAEPLEPQLVRLATPRAYLSPLAAHASSAALLRPEFEWASQTAVAVGTVVHDELLGMAQAGVDAYMGWALDARKAHYARRLRLLGVVAGEIEAAAVRVAEALHRVLDDPTGRWILAPHAEARSELRLSVRSPDGLRHLQLDRTFVDDSGVRWIIDYKTSQHEGAGLETFLATEVERYREQLEAYAAAMAAVDPRPIRLALYFPLLETLRDWPYKPALDVVTASP